MNPSMPTPEPPSPATHADADVENPPEGAQHGSIEVLVRGVCLMEGQLLICSNRQVGNRYLPGGHIDFGESARDALEREILEELGCRSRAGRFLGLCEHRFRQQGHPHAEINLLFALHIADIAPPHPPPAREPWLAFEWHALEALAYSSLQPAALRERIPEWIRAPQAIERFQSFSEYAFTNGSGG